MRNKIHDAVELGSAVLLCGVGIWEAMRDDYIEAEKKKRGLPPETHVATLWRIWVEEEEEKRRNI